jgi:ATP-dependent Clp protease ATP-binding subunit ClpA
MGMVGGGMSRAMVAQQAKGEKDTLLPRIEVTEKSIKTLEEAQARSSESSHEFVRIEILLLALIDTNLIQLKANLKEGVSRVTYLNEVIKQAESPVHRAIVHPVSKQ